MRLTGGEGKGRRLLDAPPNVRPTTGRIREQLFFMLRDELDGATVLDLYAGTGILGLEALARGASHAFFVDRDRAALQTIRGNIKRCGWESRTTVVPGDVLNRIQQRAHLRGPFELILADPPYENDDLPELLSKLHDSGLPAQNGLLVYETRRTRDPVDVDGWTLLDDRSMGGTRFFIYEHDRDPAVDSAA